MNWYQRIPFLRLLLFLIVGVLLDNYIAAVCSFQFALLLFTSVLFLIAIWLNLLNRAHIAFGVLVSLSLLLLGALMTSISKTKTPMQFSESRTAYCTAEIEAIKKSEYSTRLVCRVQASSDSIGIIKEEDFSCLIYLQDSSPSGLIEGEQIVFKANLEPIKEPELSYHFNRKEFYASKGIYFRAYLKKDDYLILPNSSFSIRKWRARLIKWARNVLVQYKIADREIGYLLALSLGTKEGLNEDLKEAYQKLGLSHILAVSGLHVGIIWFILNSILKWIPIVGRKSSLIAAISVIALWIYVPIAGAGPSVVRAALMISFYSLGAILGRKASTMNIIMAVAFLLLVWKPDYLFDLGFLLSFSAVIAIVAIAPFLRVWLKNEKKIVSRITEILVISLVAQIATLPIVLHVFGTFPTYFLLSNLLFLPTLIIELYLLLVLFALSPFTSVLLPISSVFSYYMDFKDDFLIRLSELPYACLEIQIKTPLVSIGLCVLIISIFLVILGRKFGQIKLALIAMLFLMSYNWTQETVSKAKRFEIAQKSNEFWIEKEEGGVVLIVADTSSGRWDYYLDKILNEQEEIEILNPNDDFIAQTFAIKHGYFVSADTILRLRKPSQANSYLTERNYSVP